MFSRISLEEESPAESVLEGEQDEGDAVGCLTELSLVDDELVYLFSRISLEEEEEEEESSADPARNEEQIQDVLRQSVKASTTSHGSVQNIVPKQGGKGQRPVKMQGKKKKRHVIMIKARYLRGVSFIWSMSTRARRTGLQI